MGKERLYISVGERRNRKEHPLPQALTLLALPEHWPPLWGLVLPADSFCLGQEGEPPWRGSDNKQAFLSDAWEHFPSLHNM